MPKKPYMPQTADGINTMLVAFDSSINVNAGALALKYGLTAAELTRVKQGRLVWQWFIDALDAARKWAQSLTDTRDTMQTGVPASPESLPGGPTLPPVPVLDPGPPSAPAQLESGFFIFFSALVAGIKSAENYDPAEGTLLGIEGVENRRSRHRRRSDDVLCLQCRWRPSLDD